MAYPSSNQLQVIPRGQVTEEINELSFRNLYLHHTLSGPRQNQETVVDANNADGLGTTTVNDWTIHYGLGPNAPVVARAQGLHVLAGGWHNSFTIVFENQRFRGSTLQVMGISVEDGEWAIVGGTGQFTMARGVIYKRMYEQRNDGNIIELTVQGYCSILKGLQPMGSTETRQPMGPQQHMRPYQPMGPMGQHQQMGPYQHMGPQQQMGPYQTQMNNRHPTKIGPWGGDGGSNCDITETPRRLESLTIYSGWVIDSIAFTYINQFGEIRAAGSWGGEGGDFKIIRLDPSEYIKEFSGTTAYHENHLVVSSLKFVTKYRTYGPFGRTEGDGFNAPIPNNGSVVGFFGRSGSNLDAIGVYTI